MKKSLFALLSAAALALAAGSASAQNPGDAPAGAYKLDPGHASLTWRINHMGLSNYTARFTKLDAMLAYDPADPTKSKLTATIDPASVRTDFTAGPKDFDKELRDDPRFFKVGQFPEIKFVSTSLEKTGATTGKMTGDLSFMGVTKPVVLDVTFNGSMKEHPFTKKGALGFSATGTVKRSAFGMTAGIPVLGDDVTVVIETEFLAQ